MEKLSYVSNKYPYTTLMTWEFYKHKHSFWEFVIVTKGSAQHLVNEKRHNLKKGDILIMKPDSIHDYKIADKDKYAHFDYYASSHSIKKAFENISESFYKDALLSKEPIILSVESSTLSMLETRLTKLNSIQTNEQYKDLSSVMYLTLLNFICSLAVESYENDKSNMPEWLSKLIAVMSKPAYLSGSMDEIIKTTNFSHGHLCRIFKEHTGQTLLSYFTKMKIDYSTVLLRNKDLTVLDVSLSLGYSSVSHFIKLFKEYMGVSPLKYRKNVIV